MDFFLTVMHDVANAMDAETFKSLRGSMFTGYLTLGGLLLTSLSFLSTRLHDFMKSPAYTERRKRLEERWPGAPMHGPLRFLTRNTQGAVFLCFLTSAMQITVGLWDNQGARNACLLVALVTVGTVAYAAIRTVRTYYTWIERFDAPLTELSRQAV